MQAAGRRPSLTGTLCRVLAAGTRNCRVASRERAPSAGLFVHALLAAICTVTCVACTKQLDSTQQSRYAVYESRAESRYDKAALIGALERIRAWWMQHDPRVAEALLPGLDSRAITEKTSRLPFRLPEEVYALYGWRNGTGSDLAQPFIWYHDFMSLDRAVAEHERMTALSGFPLMRWPAQWFPLFGFEGEHYFIQGHTQKRKALPVAFAFLEEPLATVCYRNLTTMMLTVAECLESGAVFLDPTTRSMGEKLPQIRAIHHKHNPGLPFPYAVP